MSLTCPQCQREITLEVGSGQESSALAVLTVLEGPCWVGEQFIMPVDDDLIIGRAAGNWISPESEALSDVHCRLRLSSNGRLFLEDLESDTGTWIGAQRIVRGWLGAMQSFSVGGFRFRFELQSPEGTTAVGIRVPREKDESSSLPALSRLTGRDDFVYRLTSGRFMWGRWFALAFAWLIAVHHACALAVRSEPAWPWPAWVLVGLMIGCGLAAGARRMALASGRLRYIAPILILILAVADIVGGLTGAAIACVLMGGGLLISMTLSSEPAAVVGFTLGGVSLLLSMSQVIRSLIILITSHA